MALRSLALLLMFGLGGIVIHNTGEVFVTILRLLGRSEGSRVLSDATFIGTALATLFALALTILPLARLKPSGRAARIGMLLIFISALWGIGQGLMSDRAVSGDEMRTTLYFWCVGAFLFGLPAIFSKDKNTFEIIGLAVVAAIVAAVIAGFAQLVFRMIWEIRSVSSLIVAPMGLAPAAVVWGLIVSRLPWAIGFQFILLVALLALPFGYGAFVNFPDKVALGGIFGQRGTAGLVSMGLAFAPALGAAIAGWRLPGLALLVVLPVGAIIAATIAVRISPQIPELMTTAGKSQFVIAHMVGSVGTAIIAVWLSEFTAHQVHRFERVWTRFLANPL